MKKAFVVMFPVSFAVAALAAVLLNSGCEQGTGTQALTVSPQTAALGNAATNVTSVTIGSNSVSTVAGDSVVFTVTAGLRDLSLPLKWSVSSPVLGSITASGGNSAVYSANTGRHGVNSITVQDQYGAQGVAQVDQ